MNSPQKINEEQQENKEKLKQFASQLKKLSFPSSPITIELADFVATALENYLSNEAETLDAAFGLTPKLGAPGYSQDFWYKQAKQVRVMRLAGMSWKDVVNKMGGDERNIRGNYYRFKNEITAEEINPEDLFE